MGGVEVKICAYPKCTRPADGPLRPFESASANPEFCSWGCWNGDESRKMWAEVKKARAMVDTAHHG